MRIFLIAGKSGSGKNEIAKIITEYYTSKSEKCVITEYSKYLKLLAQELNYWNGKEDSKPRDFLQSLGGLIKDYHHQFLINRMVEDIKIYMLLAIDNVIISDVRLPIEIEMMRSKYKSVIVIYVQNQFTKKSKLTKKQQSHYTETALDNYSDFDYVVINDEKSKLKTKINKILDGIK